MRNSTTEYGWKSNTRCRDIVKLLWCCSYLVVLLLGFYLYMCSFLFDNFFALVHWICHCASFVLLYHLNELMHMKRVHEGTLVQISFCLWATVSWCYICDTNCQLLHSFSWVSWIHNVYPMTFYFYPQYFHLLHSVVLLPFLNVIMEWSELEAG